MRLHLVILFFLTNCVSLPVAVSPLSIETPSCYTLSKGREYSPYSIPALKAAQSACIKKPQDQSSTWNQEVIQTQPKLQFALSQFTQGKRGGMARNLDLKGLTAKEMHNILLANGFSEVRTPLIYSFFEKTPRYWLNDGEFTFNPAANKDKILPFSVYSHPDGSVVTLKSNGIPDKTRKNPRPNPHYSKTVLLSLNPKEDGKLDTSFENAAFKVSEVGVALPKSPVAAHGLRLPKFYENFEQNTIATNAWIDYVMNQAHPEILTDYSHCIKEPLIENHPPSVQ